MPNPLSLFQLAIGLIPALAVIAILFHWKAAFTSACWAMVRMLIQLMLIGYVLTSIFSSDQSWVIGVVILVMISVAAWISLRTVSQHRMALYRYSFLSILVGGGSVLAIVVLGVLSLEPWFAPRYVVPLAGMIFANSMNAIALAVDRFAAERSQSQPIEECRRIALEASLIPTTNALLAVGLVSIPGMMTGQVLAGVEPLIAARYQIMVMCMVYGASGLSSAMFLALTCRLRELGEECSLGNASS